MYLHVRDTGHSFDFNNVQVLALEKFDKKRKFIESAYSSYN